VRPVRVARFCAATVKKRYDQPQTHDDTSTQLRQFAPRAGVIEKYGVFTVFVDELWSFRWIA